MTDNIYLMIIGIQILVMGAQPLIKDFMEKTKIGNLISDLVSIKKESDIHAYNIAALMNPTTPTDVSDPPVPGENLSQKIEDLSILLDENFRKIDIRLSRLEEVIDE